MRCLQKAALTTSRTRNWTRDESGVAAIEFAIIALPFMLFVLGLLAVGLYFLASTSLEYGVESASRKLLTGQAKKESMTAGDFRQDVCRASGPTIDCDKLRVLVESADNWDGLRPQPCLKNGQLTGSTGEAQELISKYSGGADKVVMVTLCYEWELANTFQFLKLGKNTDGSGPAIIQAATAFKSEPYE
jgi:hypothetical protein